jgi:hypothetical protein
MPIALTICALGNLSFVPRWFKFHFTLIKVFNIEDRLIGGCRFQIYKKHSEWYICPLLCDIPNICDLVSKLLNLNLDVVWINGVVHVFKYYSIISFLFSLGWCFLLRLYINEKIKPPLFATISHRVFIIHVQYYMFRLCISHLQVYHVLV